MVMMNKMIKIKLMLGKRYEIVDVRNQIQSEENVATLKDLATIIYCCIGQGVSWNLTSELSKRLNIPYDLIDKVFNKIIEDYCQMEDEEALKNFYNTRTPDKMGDNQ